MRNTTKKLAVIVMAMTMCLGAMFIVTGCNETRVASPFTQEEILYFLSSKYGGAFVINGIVHEANGSGPFVRRVYSVSPKESRELSFFVVDKNIQSASIGRWDRVLFDTFSHSLVEADFLDITMLCDALTLVMPNFEKLLSAIDGTSQLLDNQVFDNKTVNIFLEFSKNFQQGEIALIIQQLLDVRDFLIENFERYKTTYNLVHLKTFSENIILEKKIQNNAIKILIGQETVLFTAEVSVEEFTIKVESVLTKVVNI